MFLATTVASRHIFESSRDEIRGVWVIRIQWIWGSEWFSVITAVTGAVRGNFWGLRDMVQKILSRQSAANCQLRRCVDVKKHTCGDVEKHSCGYVKKHCVKILRNIVAEASRK